MDTNLLASFIIAREQLRTQKERFPHEPDQWTTDKILRQFHFCNIDREDDYVTKWIAEHVRKPNRDKGLKYKTMQLLACRIFNEPAMLKKILPVAVNNLPGVARIIEAHQAAGHKTFRGAYMVAAHGTAISAHAYYLRVLADAYALPGWPTEGCAHLWKVAEHLVQVHGIGDFIVNQVMADLRYSYPTGHWKDWQTFVWGGPGTKRGANRVMQVDVDKPWNRFTLTAVVIKIRDTLLKKESGLPEDTQESLEDPNNVSNSLCEFDKYCRAQDQIAVGDSPRLRRKYAPNPIWK